MDIRKLAHDQSQQIIAYRRDFHQHPELSMQEFHTTGKIMSILTEHGISCRQLNPTGVIAEISGAAPGKTVALRADMDALPLTEEAPVPFKSIYHGKMHACGHDTHTAMLLGAALLLQQLRSSFTGTVRLIFQPGEEIGAGAKAVIEQGGLDGVDMIFGEHIICPMPKGMIQFSKGPSHASSDSFQLTVHGKASHAASPHAGSDALLCAAQMVVNLQTILSREIDPLEPAVVTVGTFHAGTAENILASTVQLTGTVRTTSRATHQRMPELFHRHVQGIASACGCQVDVTYQSITEVVDNDAHATDIAMRAAQKVNPNGKLICKGLRTLGGEDFGAYSARIPATFCSIGGGGTGPMHGSSFCPDEETFEIGTALYVQFALEMLSE